MDRAFEEDPIGLVEAKKRPRFPRVNGDVGSSSGNDVFLRLSSCTSSLQEWSSGRRLHLNVDMKQLQNKLLCCRDNIGNSARGDMEYLNAIALQYFSTLFIKGSTNPEPVIRHVSPVLCPSDNAGEKGYCVRYGIVCDRFCYGKASVCGDGGSD
ncbi:hypothetical protein ACFE04_000538 [Oxalis oulophora]